MKFRILLLATITVAAGTQAAETIVSPSQIEEITKATQEQFWMLVPPMEDPLYIHPDHIVRAVDWKSKEWPNVLKKQMTAEMETVNASMYPFYRLTLVETREGELLWYNGDRLVWQTPPPPGYNEYLFAFQHFGVDSIEALGTQELLWGRSSNIGSEILLLPEAFMESYEQDVALEAEAAALAAPMSMMLLTPPTVTNLMLAIGVESNEVEVGVYFPSGYTNPVDVFVCTSLMDWDWALFTNVSSVGISEFTWIDETATNSSSHFWVAARSDVHSDTDGIPDSLEIYIYGTNPDEEDTDGDGIDDNVEISNGTDPLYADSDGDGMGDLAEANLATSVSANGSGGVLVVVPETGWYHAIDPNLELVYLGE